MLWRESKGKRQKKEILKCPARGYPPSRVPGQTSTAVEGTQTVRPMDDADQGVGVPCQLTSPLPLDHSLMSHGTWSTLHHFSKCFHTTCGLCSVLVLPLL